MSSGGLGNFFKVALAVAALAVGPLSATTVASVRAMGMGGTAVAYAQDAIAPWYNPATVATLGYRSDVGVECKFNHRHLELSNRGDPAFQTGTFRSIQLYDVYGEGGVTSHMDWCGYWSFGLQWNNYEQQHVHYKTQMTDFSGFTLTDEPAGTHLKFNYRVEVLTGTLAYSWDNITYAVAANAYFSWLDLKGFEILAANDITIEPENATNRASDNANGIGVTFGALGKFWCDDLAIGFTYSPKVNMGAFDKYRGFLATHAFDIPETWRWGASYYIPATETTGVTFAADAEWRRYSQVASWSNSFPGSGLDFGPLFGERDGPGFDWRDQWIFKTGFNYRFSQYWAVRAGYRHEQCPIRSHGGTDTALNALTLNTIEDFVSIGATLFPDCMSELSAFGEYGFNRRIGSNFPDIDSGAFWVSGDVRFQAFTATVGLAYGLTF